MRFSFRDIVYMMIGLLLISRYLETESRLLHSSFVKTRKVKPR